MPLVTEAGTFTLNTGTGNQTVTLSNFTGITPQAVILWTSGNTGDAHTNGDAFLSFGFATASTEEACASAANEDNNTTSDNYRRFDNASCICVLDNTGTITEQADFTSFGTNNFSINVSTGGAAIIVNYLVLGGSSMTNAFVKHWTDSGASGSQVVTGVGFTPDAAITLGTGQGAANSTAANWQMITCLWDGTNEHSLQSVGRDNRGTSDEDNYTEDTAITFRPPANNNPTGECSLTTFNSDGFEVNWNSASNSSLWATLCLQGGDYEVGRAASGTSTATPVTITSTTSITPHSAFYLSTSDQSWAPTVGSGTNHTVGAGDSTNNTSGAAGADDGVGVSDCRRTQDASASLFMYDGTMNKAEIATTTFSGADLQTVFGTATSTSRHFAFMVFGDGSVDVTPTPSVLTLNAAALAPTPEILNFPATLVITPAEQAPVPQVTKLPSVLNLASAEQAPTVTLDTTQTPSALDLVASEQAPTIVIGNTVIVTEQILASAEQAPVPIVLVAPSVLDLVSAEQAPIVDTGADPVITPNAQVVASSHPASTTEIIPTHFFVATQLLKSSIASVSGGVILINSITIAYEATAVDLVATSQAPSELVSIVVSEQIIVSSEQAPVITTGTTSPTITPPIIDLPAVAQTPVCLVTVPAVAEEVVATIPVPASGVANDVGLIPGINAFTINAVVLVPTILLGDRLHTPGVITLNAFDIAPTVIAGNDVVASPPVVSFVSSHPTATATPTMEPSAQVVAAGTQSVSILTYFTPSVQVIAANDPTPSFIAGTGATFAASAQTANFSVPQPSVDEWFVFPSTIDLPTSVQAPIPGIGQVTTVSLAVIRAFAFSPIFNIDVNFVIGIAELPTIAETWDALFVDVNNPNIWEATIATEETWQVVLEDIEMTVVSRDFISIPVSLKQTATANYNLVTGSTVEASLVTPHSREVQVAPVTLVENTHWTASSNSVTADFPATGTDLTGNVINKTPVILEIQVTPPNGKVRSFFSDNIPVLFDTID